MKSFAEVISEATVQYGGYNLLFERGMYSLMEDLERIVAVVRRADIPFEVVGGVAVNAHVSGVDRSRAFVTRNVDLLVNRQDLDKIVPAAEAAGYSARKMMGGIMLIRQNQNPREAVHLIFAGERLRSTYPATNPSLAPEEKYLSEFALTVPVARIRELVQMKLNSLRPKDETHLQILDECGLITPEVEEGLPGDLRVRLSQARSRYDIEQFEDENT